MTINQETIIIKKIIQVVFIFLTIFLSNTLFSYASNLYGFCVQGSASKYNGQKQCSEIDEKFIISKTKIINGSKEFCSRLMNSHWSYLPLDLDHSVPREEVKKYFTFSSEADIYPKAGYFDINNDGTKEYIGWIQLYSGSGQGCTMEIFVELDDQKTHIKNSDLSDVLKIYSPQGLPSCREYNRAFEFEGKIYIENRRNLRLDSLEYSRPSTLSKVYIINGNSRKTVCEFKTTVK